MDLKDVMELHSELEREAYWEKYISEQDNANILRGMSEGMKLRRDYPLKERMYYISLIDKRIDILSKPGD